MIFWMLLAGIWLTIFIVFIVLQVLVVDDSKELWENRNPIILVAMILATTITFLIGGIFG